MYQLSTFWRGELGFSRRFWLLNLASLLIFAVLYLLGHALFFQIKIRFGQALSLAYGFLWAALTIAAVWRGAATLRPATKILASAYCAAAAGFLAGLLAGLLVQDPRVLTFTFPPPGFWEASGLAHTIALLSR